MQRSATSSSHIQMVYFDLGNVLLGFDHGLGCQQLAQLYNTDAQQVRDLVFGQGLEDRYERGEISTQEFYETLCDSFGARPELAAVKYAAANIFHVRYDTVPIVSMLKGTGMRTGILSNTCEAHWHYVIDGRYRFLNDLFDHVVLSYEARSMKPDPTIYEVAIAEARCAPEEIFFMDDRAENVEGARAMGIDAVLFTHGAQLAEDLRQRGLRFNY